MSTSTGKREDGPLGGSWIERQLALKKQYALEPWGKFLISIGYEPYDTESCARDVAVHAAEKIAELESIIEGLYLDNAGESI